MKIAQKRWNQSDGWFDIREADIKDNAQLVLLFGSSALLKGDTEISTIKEMYPKARIVGCSTAGEILDTSVTDETLAMTAIEFEKTELKFVDCEIKNMEESFDIGAKIAEELVAPGLAHIFVLSDGLNVNGSKLVKGINSKLPEGVSVTGGLSGDGPNFKETFVCHDQGCRQNHITAIGFYGDSIKIGYGSLGGWDAFGPERMVTKSEKNVLFELDGKSALNIYKEYLGEKAEGLPATGLLFPLSLHQKDATDAGLVRTLLSIDDNEGSMTFAGDLPEGSYVQFMKANFDRLIDGAAGAATETHVSINSTDSPDLAILISCVGRKLVLKQRVEEEVESVSHILGETTGITGFYSYGEICPVAPTEKQCELHNQTMTITTFTEK